MNTTVSTIYFSPTGNTKKTVEAMASAIRPEFQTFDITVCPPEQETAFTGRDFVIFGVPVYAGRVPTPAAERLRHFRGDATPCLAVVTYGNRHYDDALLELAQLLKSQGFLLKGGAALLARHTYGRIQTERPDRADLEADRTFARRAFEKPEGAPEPSIPGNIPYRDGTLHTVFRPLTSSACTRCGLCVRNCPVQAIGEDCVTVTDACLSCFRCIRQCPAGAKNIDTPEYREFAEMFTEKLKERRENEYFL